MNALTKTATTLPTPISHDLGRKVRYFSNSLDPEGLGHTIQPDRAPREGERQLLALRASAIDEWMRPSGRERALDEVTALFSNRGVRGSDTDIEALMTIYVEDLFDLPAFALTQACRDFRQGAVGDRKWVPTQAEIRQIATGHLAELARERRQIANILAAKIKEPRCSPEKRAAALRSLEEAKRALSMPEPPLPRRDNPPGSFPLKLGTPSQQEIEDAAKQRLAELATMSAPALSREALAKFGINPPPDRDERTEDAA